MGNKVLGQYTEAGGLPLDSIFYTVVSGVTYKTTLDAIQSGRATTVLELTDTPSSYGTTASRSDPSKYYFLSVNSANTATEFAQVRFTDLNETPSSIAGDGSDNDGQKFYGIAQGASTLTAEYAKFTGLNDVPHSYAGSALYLVRVNAAADALEFIDLSSIIPNLTGFLELTDTPSSYLGQAGKYLVVDSAETGVEFTSVAPSSSSVCGETLDIFVPNSSAAVLNIDAFPYPQIALNVYDGSDYVFSQWMKPTGFDSGKDITMDLSFIGAEHDALNPRYYYNIYCVTGTNGSVPNDSPHTTSSPLITDYVDMTGAATNELRKKRHSFSAALSDDVVALYFRIERTDGTSGQDLTASGININGIGLTYHQL